MTTSPLPAGTVTFLFTDIEGSASLWEREPEAMRAALARHDAIFKTAIAGHAGVLYKHIGDAVQAAFPLPASAVLAALAAQRALAAEAWPTSQPIRVRMGLHTGPALPAETDYTTTHTLNRVARIMGAAHGGQVLLSAETAQLTRGDLPGEVSVRDLAEHRMKGLAQLEHLFQLVAPDLPADFPPLATRVTTPNNLPTPVTSFIGREPEMAEIKQRLASAHLLTLTGSGGTGKTRLSLQAAAAVLPEYPDGVWLVELAPLTDPAMIPSALLTILELREQPGRRPQAQIIDYLRAKRVLLILDNCEHLIAAGAQLAADLLAVCPQLKI
nr:adenylate/guanylate cyclase domain-containing protein [Anaerolineales bacterium]